MSVLLGDSLALADPSSWIIGRVRTMRFRNEAMTYVLQACEAIGEAHALGIVHRDIKPANPFLVGRPDGARASW